MITYRNPLIVSNDQVDLTDGFKLQELLEVSKGLHKVAGKIMASMWFLVFVMVLILVFK